MIEASVIVRCDGFPSPCGKEIPPPVMGGGDEQGGEVFIEFGTLRAKLHLCEDCKAPLLRTANRVGQWEPGGTEYGVARLAVMPFIPA